MKISGCYRATNILLLVIVCLWCQVQPTAGGKCSGVWAIHACAGGNGKRSDSDDMAPIDLGGAGEGPDTEEGTEGEKTGGRGGGGGGGGREREGFRGSKEGADLRSEFNDREPLLDERQLLDIGNRRGYHPNPRDAALGRLSSLLRTSRIRYADDDEGVEDQPGEEPPRRSSTDTDGRYINRDNLTMLRRILDDLARKLDSQRQHDRAPDSVRKEQSYVGAKDSYYYSLQKRAADQLGHTN